MARVAASADLTDELTYLRVSREELMARHIVRNDVHMLEAAEDTWHQANKIHDISSCGQRDRLQKYADKRIDKWRNCYRRIVKEN